MTEENVFNVIWEKDKEIVDETVQKYTTSRQVAENLLMEDFRNLMSSLMIIYRCFDLIELEEVI